MSLVQTTKYNIYKNNIKSKAGEREIFCEIYVMVLYLMFAIYFPLFNS